ncbi:hypothetical protein BaRGS_00001843 [Batillaria attramentaria]|uniref:DUF2723 domain-containing protein n=1 Tax=Batillaria attramentaria TaxID=370345 RepID=A0ABD0M665_9CAEN
MGRESRGRGGRKDGAAKTEIHKDGEGTSEVLQWSRIQVTVMGVLTGVYLATMHRSLPGGDAGELIVAADELGVAHPPGYPLYTLLLKLSFLLVPNGTVALKANLLTAVMGAAAGGFLFQAGYLLTGCAASGFLAAGMFAFSRLTWTWSVGAEVFTLNNLLLAVLLVTAVCFGQSPPNRRTKLSLLGAFICGLCLSNQHTSVVYVAVLALWVLFTLYRDKVLSLKLLVQISMCFLVGLLPYAYLPISAVRRQARWTWGDQSTLRGFLTHLFRTEYGTLHLLKDHEGQGLIQGLMKQGQQREVIVVLLLMLVTYAVFFAWRANLDINSPLYLGVVERFWLQSDLVVVDRFVPLRKVKIDVVIALLISFLQLRTNLRSCDQSNNFVVHDFAMITLRAFPEGYFHVSEGVRPDLVIVDQEVLTYNWSIPMMGSHLKGIVFPGDQLYSHSGLSSQGRKLFTFRQLLDANYDRKPLFGCVGVQEHERSWQEAYELRPFGVCMQFIKKGSDLEAGMKEWLESSRRFAAEWVHPLPEHDATWDDVASSEMWRAMTVAGFHLLENADRVDEQEKKTAWLQEAYLIYKKAIESHPRVPAYWHKNFALVCEKLRHLSPKSDSLPLLKASIAHFKIYLDSDTTDPQRDAIQNAIQSLQTYVDHFEKDSGNGV